MAEYFGLPAYSRERGELLGREALTAARLYEWAKQASVKNASSPVEPRRERAVKRTPEQVEIDRLKRENDKLAKLVKRQETVIDI